MESITLYFTYFEISRMIPTYLTFEFLFFRITSTMLHISTTISILLTILVAVLFYILRYFKTTYSYWEKRNIPYVKPTIPFGNLSKVFTREWTLGQAFGELYLELKKRGVKHGGIFSLNKPTYIPVDPEIIKHIIISDADNFPNHGLYINTTDDPLSGHIFNMEGNRWKDLRTKLPKAFTCARMREMFVMIERFSEELHKLLETCRQKQNGINIKNELEKFTADVISLCGFGLESNAMKGQNEDLLKHSRTFFDYQWNIYKNSMVFGFSREVLKQFNFKIFPTETTKYVKDMFGKVKINRTEKNIERGDLANTIISLCERNEKYKDYSGKKVMDPLNDNEYVAQMWIFFCASFETSSSTLTFILYELSKNPEYQQKLRNEIETVLERYDNKITYDSIMEMKYLEQVIDGKWTFIS